MYTNYRNTGAQRSFFPPQFPVLMFALGGILLFVGISSVVVQSIRVLPDSELVSCRRTSIGKIDYFELSFSNGSSLRTEVTDLDTNGKCPAVGSVIGKTFGIGMTLNGQRMKWPGLLPSKVSSVLGLFFIVLGVLVRRRRIAKERL